MSPPNATPTSTPNRAARQHYPTKAKRNAALAVELAKANPLRADVPTYPRTAGGAMVEAHTAAQVASALSRLAARYRRLVGRARRIELGLKNDPRDDVPAWLKTVEPLVSSIWVVLLTAWLIGAALEALGTIPSLAIYSSTIGQDGQVPGLAIAVGATLMLLGHFAGWLFELSGRATGRARAGLLVAAAALLIFASAAIIGVSDGRETNLAASGKLGEAGVLEERAQRLETQASRAERRAETPPGSRVGESAEARTMRAEAADLLDEAQALKEEAFDERKLGWFVFVQFAALALAVITGWAFSVCSPLRLKRRAERFKRRADKVWGRAWNKCQVIAELGGQTIALATIHAGQGAVEYQPRDRQGVARLFLNTMNPPTEPEPEAVSDPAPDEADELRLGPESDGAPIPAATTENGTDPLQVS